MIDSCVYTNGKSELLICHKISKNRAGEASCLLIVITDGNLVQFAGTVEIESEQRLRHIRTDPESRNAKRADGKRVPAEKAE